MSIQFIHNLNAVRYSKTSNRGPWAFYKPLIGPKFQNDISIDRPVLLHCWLWLYCSYLRALGWYSKGSGPGLCPRISTVTNLSYLTSLLLLYRWILEHFFVTLTLLGVRSWRHAHCSWWYGPISKTPLDNMPHKRGHVSCWRYQVSARSEF